MDHQKHVHDDNDVRTFGILFIIIIGHFFLMTITGRISFMLAAFTAVYTPFTLVHGDFCIPVWLLFTLIHENTYPKRIKVKTDKVGTYENE